MNRTYTNKEGDIERKWYIVDAAGVPVGRLAAQVAQYLRGKHKPTFDYHMDTGDHVIIINAAKVALTGNKRDELIYWHTGWPDGLRNVSRGKLQDDNPVRLVEKAVWGMSPKTKLGRASFKKLRIYAGDEHPHAGQNPIPLDIRKDK